MAEAQEPNQNSPPPGANATDEWTFACHAARLMTDNHCEHVVVLDIRGLSQVSDFFVIGTGTSERQLQSVAADLKLLAKQDGQPVFRSHGTGDGSSQWLVMDFVNVVAHLFTADQRAYYDLESLWGDASRVNWHACTQPGQFAKLSASRQRP
jgi:ribosome-associated protein